METTKEEVAKYNKENLIEMKPNWNRNWLKRKRERVTYRHFRSKKPLMARQH